MASSRRHGKNSRLYASITSGGSAESIAFIQKWSIDFSVDFPEVTALGDSNKIRVAGLPDASGDFTGFFDTATAQTYQAAIDGQPRNFYLYPSNQASQMSPVPQYFFGTILPDYALTGGVTAAVSLKSTWNAASKIARYPTYGLAGT